MKTQTYKPIEGALCHLCGTNEVKKCILVPIVGTENENGDIIAIQVHSDCIANHIQYNPGTDALEFSKKPIEKNYILHHTKEDYIQNPPEEEKEETE